MTRALGVGAEDWLGKSLAPGKHTIVFDFKYDGPGLGKGGTGVLTVDGRVLLSQNISHANREAIGPCME